VCGLSASELMIPVGNSLSESWKMVTLGGFIIIALFQYGNHLCYGDM